MKQCIRQLGIMATFVMLFFLVSQMEVSAANRRGELTVSFLDVGQGDSILLQSEGQTMLVDAGKAEYGKTVVEYLKEQGITELTYAVITHDDADHIGGFASVVNNISIKKIYRTRFRNNEEVNSKKANDIIEQSNISIEIPVIGSTMQFGSATIQFLAPNSNQYTAYNDYSIVMRVVNGKNSFLLTGDAESISEMEMLKKGYPLKSDVLKVGHHSALTSSSQEFIDAVDPSISVISCNSEGKAGFPRLGTLAKLTMSDIFRTDISGNIVMVSDGTNITTEQEPYFYANSAFNSSTGDIDRTMEEECSTLKEINMDADCDGLELQNIKEDDNYEQVYRQPIELTFSADCGVSKLNNIQYCLVDSNEEPDIDSMDWNDTDEGSITLKEDFNGAVYVKFENQLGNIVIRKTTGFLLDCKVPTDCKVKSNIPKLRLVSSGAINTYNRYTNDDWYPTFTFSCKYGKSGKGKIEYMLVERGEVFHEKDPWTSGKTVTITDDFIGRVYVRFTDGAGNCIIKKTQGFKWIQGKPINQSVGASVPGVELLNPVQKAKTCVVNKNRVILSFSADFGHGGKEKIEYQIVKKAKKYNDRGPWVRGDSVTLSKGFHGVVYVRFMDKGGYCNIRKTNTIRIKK